jgi:hypothetical protein
MSRALKGRNSSIRQARAAKAASTSMVIGGFPSGSLAANAAGRVRFAQGLEETRARPE